MAVAALELDNSALGKGTNGFLAEHIRNPFKKTEKLPFYKEITEILSPLEYSGFFAYGRNDTTVSVDFLNQAWTVHNVHRYDPKGRILLDQNRYGVCGELASYVRDKIRSFSGDKFGIMFAQVTESGFFPGPKPTHIVLVIQEKSTRKMFVIDPSLHRYGSSKDLQEYLYFGFSNELAGIKNHETDVQFEADRGAPVLIRNGYIASIYVGNCEGKFDEDNFTIAIRAIRRFKYTGRTLLSLRKKEGQIQIFRDKELIRQVFSPEQAQQAEMIVNSWFLQIDPSAELTGIAEFSS